MRKVILYSGSGDPKGTIVILPVHLCGYTSYTRGGELVRRELSPECSGCTQLVETPGGRGRELICLNPRHYRGRAVNVMMLTAPERVGLYDQLGDKYDDYVRPASCHGTWKLNRRQAVVVVPES